MNKPVTYNADLAHLPPLLSVLMAQKRWLVWRWELNKKEKWTKPPYRARNPKVHASSNNAETWATYDEALAVIGAEEVDGIGFSLSEAEEGAVDLDQAAIALKFDPPHVVPFIYSSGPRPGHPDRPHRGRHDRLSPTERAIADFVPDPEALKNIR